VSNAWSFLESLTVNPASMQKTSRAADRPHPQSSLVGLPTVLVRAPVDKSAEQVAPSPEQFRGGTSGMAI